MATHSSILAWRISGTEEPGRLYSPCGLKESNMAEWNFKILLVVITHPFPRTALKELLNAKPRVVLKCEQFLILWKPFIYVFFSFIYFCFPGKIFSSSHLNNHCVCSVAQLCPTLCNPVHCGPPGSSPWDSPEKNTGGGCHFLLQGIGPTQDQTPVSCVSCIAGRFFTVSPLGKPSHDHYIPSNFISLNCVIWANQAALLFLHKFLSLGRVSTSVILK